jgi:hypothetical protein
MLMTIHNYLLILFFFFYFYYYYLGLIRGPNYVPNSGTYGNLTLRRVSNIYQRRVKTVLLEMR